MIKINTVDNYKIITSDSVEIADKIPVKEFKDLLKQIESKLKSKKRLLSHKDTASLNRAELSFINIPKGVFLGKGILSSIDFHGNSLEDEHDFMFKYNSYEDKKVKIIYYDYNPNKNAGYYFYQKSLSKL